VSPSDPESKHTRHLVVIAYDGVRLLDVAGPLEAFHSVPVDGAYRVTVVSPTGGNVVTHTGTAIDTVAAAEIAGEPIDTLLVPGALAWRASIDDEPVRELVRATAPRSRRVASICAGAFIVAAAGLLDGHRAATHWRLADELAERFPQVEVDGDAIHLRSGNVYSSAGVSAGIDLSLALIEEDLGPAVSRAVARELVVFTQRPGGQAQFSVRLEAPVTNHETLRALLDSVVADPSLDHRLAALSERSGFSERHLTRLFRAEFGTTPGRYVVAVRVEAARALLEQTQLTLEVVAERSGLGSAETLRRIFVRELGVPPQSYRRRFATVGLAA
jgi:transcriptional regulator GlxA family with amidase domain